MTKASDNAFPSILITEGTEPSAPAAGKQRLYIDSTTHKLKRTDSSGTDVTIESTGAVATDAIWDAAGDLAVGTGADTAAKLTLGASGTYPRSNGTTLAYAFPPGHEFDYAQITSSANVTATSAAAADTIITGAAVTYDGSTVVLAEFSCPYITPPTGALHNVTIVLYDGSSQVGQLGIVSANPTNASRFPVRMAYRFTPSNASHTYSIRSYVDSGTGTINCGAGGNATYLPAFLRITKAT